MRFYTILLAVIIFAACLALSAAESPGLTGKYQSSTFRSFEKSRLPAANQRIAEAVFSNSDDEAKRISLEDAKKAFDAGEAVFVDARSVNSYVNEHIKGSVNIPLAEFEKRYKELPEDKTIIVYCS